MQLRVLISVVVLHGIASAASKLVARAPPPQSPGPPNRPPTCQMLTGFAVNKTYIANAIKGDDKDGDDKGDEALRSMLAANPNLTLWDIFIQRTREIGHNLEREKNKPMAVLREGAKITGDVVENLITYTAAAVGFMAEVLYKPKAWWRSVKHWFHDFGKGTEEVGHMLWHEPLKYIGGGIMLNLVDHTAEFVAETGLLVAGGFAVIHGFMHGIEALLGTLPAAVSTSLLSTLVFIHCLDDPILILAPVFQMTVDTVSSTSGDPSLVNRTVTMQLPAGATLATPLPRLATCQLPPSSPAYMLRYGDLCDMSEPRLLRLLYGLDGANGWRNRLTRENTIEAWNRYQDFTCCYGPTTFKLDDLNDKVPGAGAGAGAGTVPVAAKGCKGLLGRYPDEKKGPQRRWLDQIQWDRIVRV